MTTPVNKVPKKFIFDTNLQVWVGADTKVPIPFNVILDDFTMPTFDINATTLPTRKRLGEPTTVDKIKTLGEIFTYPKLSKYVGLNSTKQMRAPTTYVGIEIELEHVDIKNFPKSTFKQVEDGSLKVNGAEFVTVPIQVRFLDVELQRLFGGIKARATKRCSVHVHLNIRDFTADELTKFILLYSIYEKALFNFSGNRWDNNFCVPVFANPKDVIAMLRSLSKTGNTNTRWSKYCSFNLSPIFGGESTKIGTAEFRHLVGTTNKDYILDWVNLIVSLKIAAKSIVLDELLEHIRTMNTTSGYTWLTNYVFKFCAGNILHQPTFKEDIESCITRTKTICIASKLLTPKESTPIKINFKE